MAADVGYREALCPLINNVLVCMRQGNSRILVDAEHTYMQPAIDALAIRAQQRCNRSEPVVINTYQARSFSCAKLCPVPASAHLPRVCPSTAASCGSQLRALLAALLLPGHSFGTSVPSVVTYHERI